mgnify:CR=1 FL=1
MEQQTRDYFVKRLNEVAQEKVQAKAVELFGETGRPEQPTWGQVFEGIKNGDITLKEDKVDYTGPYLNPSDVVWPAMEARVEELKAYRETIAKEKQRAMDAVYLDADAQKALKAFEAV